MATTGRPKPSKPKRRWFQFSLRGLLAVTAVVAICLGLWVVPAWRQHTAVDTFRRPGVNVGYDDVEQSSQRPKYRPQRRSSPTSLKDLVGIDFFENVTTLHLIPSRNPPSHPITDADLEHLEALPYLESLIIDSEEVTDAGLVHLRNLVRLKELLLGAPRVTDRGLTHLESLEELQYLQLNCSVTDQGLAKLAVLKKLEVLEVFGANPSREVCRAFHDLDVPSPMDFVRVPLKDVLDYLADYHAMPFAVDEEAIEAANLAVNPPVDYTTRKAPLDAALTQMLQPHGLMWEITPDGIVVTTKGVVDSDLAVVARLKKSLPNLKKVRVCVDWKGLPKTRSAGSGR